MDKVILNLYTDYLICSTSQTTATGLSRVTDGAISHDAITRFLSEEDFTSSDLWQIAKPLARSMEATIQENEYGVLVLDDTDEEKPYTELLLHNKGNYIIIVIITSRTLLK